MSASNRMLKILFALFLCAALLCAANVFVVTLGKVHLRSGTSLEPYIQSVSLVSETVYAKRGNIYDANGQIVAQDQKTYDIICYLDESRTSGNNIAYIDDPSYTASVLSQYLNLSADEIYSYLTANPDLYQTELGSAGRNLSEEIKDAILNHEGIHGIGFKESTKRVYPQGSLFSPYLIGFAQSDDNGKLVGKMGLELYLDEELSGTDGKHVYQQDKNGYILTGMYEEYTAAENGYDVYTTLDSSLQQALDTAFDEVTEENGASKAWGSIVEISTGKILAFGQTPSFDPNVLEIEDYMNMGTQVPYEPGSVMKAFIYATAMDIGNYDGQATFDSTAYCYLSNGKDPYRTYGDRYYGCISNASGKSWGTIGLDYGLIYSSNVATSTLLSDYVGADTFNEYLERFGFFKEVDTDGIAESTGIQNYTYPSEILSLTYGQGSSVTMLQLLQAYTAIFGNGEMLKPYFIDKIVDKDNGEVVYQGSKTVVSTPIKESTAKQMQELLERVVSDPKGTAQFYAVDEVNIMAKTGTSEIVEGSGYNSDDSITSVMLAFPAEDPQYMIYFAYVSPYDYYNHTYSTPVKNLIRRTAVLTETAYQDEEEDGISTYARYEMPSLLNTDINEAITKLEEYDADVYRIGNGDTVLAQYPEKGDDLYSNEKVFLLTDKESICLPDFSGWSRKEILNYWQITALSFSLEGYGRVVSQSPSPGSSVSEGETILITFESMEDVEE